MQMSWLLFNDNAAKCFIIFVVLFPLQNDTATKSSAVGKMFGCRNPLNSGPTISSSKGQLTPGHIFFNILG